VNHAAPTLEASMSRAGAVARSIELDVAAGRIKVGERLGTKDELRRRYGVAVGTFNEAMRLLQMRGLVDARPGPGGGLFATAPSASVRLGQMVPGFRKGGATAADCLVVRNALEPLVATEAARHAGRRDVAELRRIVERMAESLDDPRAYLRGNWDLHRRMATISENSVLSSAYLTVLDFAEEMFEAAGEDELPKPSRQNLEVHQELVDAIARGDEQLAVRAVRRHEPLTEDLG
jgi:DNA-binding FadR family transcriptional regulator